MAKKTLNVVLYVSELVYDVQNKTYLTGRSRKAGGNDEEVANMQANSDEENENQVRRSIDNAFATLKMKLSEYMSVNEVRVDNELDTSTETLTLSLQMPNNYNAATAKTISSASHQFVVNTAIGDWFTITNKNDASDYVNMAAANLLEIRESINKRVRPVRTPPTSS